MRLLTFPARFALGTVGFGLALVADASTAAVHLIERHAR